MCRFSLYKTLTAMNPSNIQEYVVKKVIEYIEKSETECSLLKHIFHDQYLKCVLCDKLVVPFDEKDIEHQDLWICPCEFCFIDEFYPTYLNTKHTNFRRRGCGEPACNSIYCYECVKQKGYNNLFYRCTKNGNQYIFDVNAPVFLGVFFDNSGD